MDGGAASVRRRIDRLLEAFSAEPLDRDRFLELEGLLREQELWSALAGVYECRIEALQPSSDDRFALLMSLGSVLERGLGAPRAALDRYRQALGVARIEERARALRAERRALVALGDLTQALQVSETELELTEARIDRAELLADVGAIWHRLGETEPARQSFARAIELDPGSDAALAGMATLAEQAGDLGRAIELYERRIAGLSGLARAHVMEQLAAALPDAERPRIRELLREVVRSFPDRRAAIERLLELERADGKLDRVDALFEQLFALLPAPERAALALEAARVQIEADASLEASLRWTDRALAEAPDDPRIHELRARIFRASGQPGGLVEALEELDRLCGPSSARALEIAGLYERVGNVAPAARVLERWLAVSPVDVDALDALDRCLCKLGRANDRHKVLDRRIALAPSAHAFAALKTELGDLLRDELGDAGGAEQAYRAALVRVPEHEPATERLKALLCQSGHFDALAELLRELAERRGPGRPQARALCDLGSLELDLRSDPEAAREAYMAALRCDPASREGLDGLRAVARSAGDTRALLEACEIELRLEPDPNRERALLMELIDAARELRDVPRARQAARRWTELEPAPAPYRVLAEIAREGHDQDEEHAALTALESAIDDPAERAACAERLGDLELERTEDDAIPRAQRHYRRALLSRPTRAVREKLIDLCRRAGELPELAQELGRELDSGEAPDPRGVRLELASVLAELGDLTAARRALTPAFEDDPGARAVADLMESLLAGEDGIDAADRPAASPAEPNLVDVLERRLAHERDPRRRREVAGRLAELLIEREHRAADAIEILREVADPSDEGHLEHLFARALEIAGTDAERIGWLEARAPHTDGEPRVDLLLRLARLYQRTGAPAQAVRALHEADRALPDAKLDLARRPLLALARETGGPAEQVPLLQSWAELARDPVARAGLRLECARILIEELGRRSAGLQELDGLPGSAPLRATELRLLVGLTRRVGDAARHHPALEALIDATSGSERDALRLELADLLERGPEGVRNPDRAERTLEALLASPVAGSAAHERLRDRYEREGRTRELTMLLERQLESAELPTAARRALVERLARARLDLGDPAGAASLLRTRMPSMRSEPDPELDELLFHCLELAGDRDQMRALCIDRTRRGSAHERARWLRRELALLEREGESPELRLPLVEQLRELEPGNDETVATWIGLLRNIGRVGTLADALDAVLRADPPPSGGRRRLLVRELLRLYDGPLHDRARALELIEREPDLEPALRMRGAELAAELGETAREAALLAPLVEAPGAATRALHWVRRLGLAYFQLERPADAAPLLWEALRTDPRDRPVLRALEDLVRADGDDTSLLELLDYHYALEAPGRQLGVAREAFALAERRCDRGAALRWLRRRKTLESLSKDEADRFVALERSEGDRPGLLQAIRLRRALATEPAREAELYVEEARIYVELGQMELARAGYWNALDRIDRAPPAWWLELDALLEREGRAAERLPVLAKLAEHPHLDPCERARTREARAALLALSPDGREEAARELQTLVDDPLLAPGEGIARYGRELAALYELLERPHDWCRVARELCAVLPDEERGDLDLRLARCLTETLGARAEATALWREILERSPEQPEALEALAGLLDRPGLEPELCDHLERYADALASSSSPCPAEVALHAAALWLRAARVRYRSLGDPSRALLCAEAGLSIDATSAAHHALRVELSARLGEPERECESLAALVRLEPETDETLDRLERLARVRLESGRPAEQVRDALEPLLDRTAPGDPQRVAARSIFEQLGDWSMAVLLLEEEADAFQGSDRARALRRLGRVLWEECGRADEADAALLRLSEVDLPDAQDRERWAEVLEALGRWPEALAQRRDSLTALGDLASVSSWLDLARLTLAHSDDLDQARAACARAEALDPRSTDVVELRIELHRRTGDTEAEVADTVRLGELLSNARDAAEALARAAAICRERLADSTRAWKLYRQALGCDASWLPALEGAGAIAIEREDWREAERMYGMATSVLRGAAESEPRAANDALGGTEGGPSRDTRLTQTGRLAAQAALAQGRDAEAFRYLDIALCASPDDPRALESMAVLSLRLGAFDRARACLERHLATSALAPEEQLPQQIRLARACEGTGDLAAAARALEVVVRERPYDEVSRAHVVDLLERTHETDRALAQLDDWAEHTAPEFRPGLALRAARIEAAGGRREKARARLEALLENGVGPGDAWVELAGLIGEQDGSAATVDVTERALGAVESEVDRGALLWMRARALHALGRVDEIASLTCEVLETDPGNVEAAQLLASHLGRAPDFRDAVTRLAHALDAGNPPAGVAAELWEAVGRAYAGPLESLVAAQRAYRRALELNPLRTSARESLADLTAFDPDAHPESIRLHRDLLESFPARPESWRALERIALHWRLSAPTAACEEVLRALGRTPEGNVDPSSGLAVKTADPDNPTVVAATELLLALEEAGGMPTPAARISAALEGEAPTGPDTDVRRVAPSIRAALDRLVGVAWSLSDAQLAEIWLRARRDAEMGDDVARRARRQLKRAQQRAVSENVPSLRPEVWREELLGQAAACAVSARRISVAGALEALIDVWPTTSHLRLHEGGDMAAALQLCPPAQVFLLRIAEAVVESLPSADDRA